LFTILRNTFLKHLERRRRRPPEESLTYEENVYPVWGTPPHSVEETTLRRERRRVLWRAIEGLPERKRQCVVLHYGYGLSYQEIAEALKVRGGTVAATLHQARSLLQEELVGHFDESDFALVEEGGSES
jgi:RNA polymerase sigma factor (sigma-70 family)